MNILAALVGVLCMPLVIGYVYGRKQHDPEVYAAYYLKD